MKGRVARLTEDQMKAAVMKILDMGYDAEVKKAKDKYIVAAVNRKKIRLKLREDDASEIDATPEDGEGDDLEDVDSITE